MLRPDLEIELMPAGCAAAYPKRYEKINIKVSNDSDTSTGIGSIQAASSRYPKDLSEQHKVTTDAVRCKKRIKSTSLVPAYGSETSNNKKKKYDDIPLPRKSRKSRNQESQKNRISNDYRISKDIGDQIRSALSGHKRNLKRKAEIPLPTQAGFSTNITADSLNNSKEPAATNAKNLPKKRHSLQIDTEDEPQFKVRNSGTMLEDDLMVQLKNIHIGSKMDESTEEITAPEPIKDLNHVPNQSINEFVSQRRILKIPTLNKLVHYARKHWKNDEKEATLASSLEPSVVVHNLPAVMKTVYQKRLREVFEKYGQITHIGPPITHTTAEGKSIFNTTVYFKSDLAATKALEEDQTRFGRAVIRVLRPLSADVVSPDQSVTFGGKSGAVCRASGIGAPLRGVVRPHPLLWNRNLDKTETTRLSVDTDAPAHQPAVVHFGGKSVADLASGMGKIIVKCHPVYHVLD